MAISVVNMVDKEIHLLTADGLSHSPVIIQSAG